jgi:hypothetical protein
LALALGRSANRSGDSRPVSKDAGRPHFRCRSSSLAERGLGRAEAPGSSPGDSTINASVAKLVDAPHSECDGLARVGSTPSARTMEFHCNDIVIAMSRQCPCGGNGRRAPLKPAFFGVLVRPRPGTPNARLAESVDARHLKRLGRSMPVRARRRAPSSRSRRQAVKASVLHTDTRSFDPSREYQKKNAAACAWGHLRVGADVSHLWLSGRARSRHGRCRRFDSVKMHQITLL